MSTLTASDLQDICHRALADLGIAGAQLALLEGETLVQAAGGTANGELGTPVTDDTVFQIGSTTKLWSAALVMQLVDAGLVDLDEPVTTYLPDVVLAAGDAWRAITPRQLMSMSSGLDSGPYADTGRGDDAIAKYVALMADLPLIFAPGTAYGYSNASTSVSGLILERLTGSSWDDALGERLIRPAGLTESVSLFDQLPYHRTAVGTQPGQANAHRPWQMGRGMAPSGSTLCTSARDLARFGALFLRGGVAEDGTRILSEAAVATMQTPQVSVPPQGFVNDWCVGPYRRDWGGLDVFGHPGTTSNGASHLVWIPERGIALALTLNTPTRAARFTGAMFDAVLRDGLGLPLPAAPDPDAVGPVDPAPYLGRYASHGRDFEVTDDDGALVLTLGIASGHDTLLGQNLTRSVIRPVGLHRFVAVDEAVTWGFGWELAFTLGPDGRASLFHNGAMAARRVA